LLSGEDICFSWGPHGSFTFRKRGGIPIIVICEGEKIPIGLHHWRFKRCLVVAPIDNLLPYQFNITADLLLSTLFGYMTELILSFRHLQKEGGLGGYNQFGFVPIWERTFVDMEGFVDPEYCFPGSILLYVEDPRKDPIN